MFQFSPEEEAYYWDALSRPSKTTLSWLNERARRMGHWFPEFAVWVPYARNDDPTPAYIQEEEWERMKNRQW